MITKGLMSSNSSEWETPQDLFNELDQEFGFVLDPCSTKENAKCQNFLTKERDGLSYPWSEFDGPVFMNPPYGREIGKWVKKAYEESQIGITVVCLLPARTDTKYFHTYCMKGEIRFLKGRVYFTNQDGKNGRAPFPSMIVIFRRLNELRSLR